jgi:hypothetical protein
LRDFAESFNVFMVIVLAKSFGGAQEVVYHAITVPTAS